jgi:hypothetical protein
VRTDKSQSSKWTIITVKNEMVRQVAASVLEVNLEPGITGYLRVSSLQKTPRRKGVAIFPISITITPTIVSPLELLLILLTPTKLCYYGTRGDEGKQSKSHFYYSSSYN